MTKVLKVDPVYPDKNVIREAAEAIKRGFLVAFPTETVYGIGADAFNESAVNRIFEVKKRPKDNPLIVHVSQFSMINDLVSVNEVAEKLMKKFWPGPLTIVMKKRESVPDYLSSGLPSLAVRMPAHPIANELISQSGTAIAAPSANLATKPSSTKAEHVLEDFNGLIEIILDGGASFFGIESTVVNSLTQPPTLLRPGVISVEEIKEVIGEIVVPGFTRGIEKFEGRSESPGMKYRHYAPKAKMFVVEGENEKIVDFIIKEASDARKAGLKVGILTTIENVSKYPEGIFKLACGSRLNAYSVAVNLFDCLRRMDREEVEIIYAEGFPENGLFLAISNRLRKASGLSIIKV